jgi:AAA+ ATPase superfamily predicted ATPase
MTMPSGTVPIGTVCVIPTGMMLVGMSRPPTNPFRYGDLALDETFTNRERELKELKSDLRNGQNVVVFAPRRFGKSSLVWRATQELAGSGEVLIAQVDLMATPSKEKLAEKLAQSIYTDIASTLFKVREKAVELFSSLRIVPRITLDPNTASLSFTFESAAQAADIDATLERLLELPAQLAAERGVRVALVIDEFQEILEIDRRLPHLMRSVFQQQPEVAHVYLGSKRSLMERIFNDENEPFWRAAKQVELELIAPDAFAPFIKERFEQSDRAVEETVIARALEITRGHPYGTQELCYFLWEETWEGWRAGEDELQAALEAVLRSENAHFSRIWDKAARAQRLLLQALAREPLQPLSEEYRRRHGLPSDATTRKALRALVDDELVVRESGGHRIGEPFLAEWIVRFES